MKCTKIAMSLSVIGVCVGLVIAGVPAAAASATPVVFDHSIAFPGPPLRADHNQLAMWVPGADDAVVVVVPGTTDNRSPHIDDLVGRRKSLIISYPESFWPVISGKSGKGLPLCAPTYDQSKSVAEAHTVAVMDGLAGSGDVIVYTGYSQGADALGNAAEQAAPGSLGPNVTVLIISDPRSPWGIKGAGKNLPFSGLLLGLLGIANDGARDPGKTGDARVVHIIVQGDPIAHTQWIWYRPVSSLVVNLVGYTTIHTATGPYTYTHIENLPHIKTLKSYEGNSTYEIYDTYHPLALLNEMIWDWLGIPVSKERLERWDARAEWFYPTQAITAVNTDPTVKLHEVPLTPDPTAPVVALPAPTTDQSVVAAPSETTPSETTPAVIAPSATPEVPIESLPATAAPTSEAPATDAPATDIPAPDVPATEVPAPATPTASDDATAGPADTAAADAGAAETAASLTPAA